MLLTICITTYNIENYILDALNSILKQNLLFDYEILIGDDGSTDNTVSLAKEWALTNNIPLTINVLKRDDGINSHILRASNNRVNLLNISKGKYITFLDGDDYYINNDFLNSAVNHLENNLQIKAYCSNYSELFNNSCLKKVDTINHDKIKKLKCFWNSMCYLPAETFVFRNELVNSECSKIYFDDNNIILSFIKYDDYVFFSRNHSVAYRQNATGYSSWKIEKAIAANTIDVDTEIEQHGRKFISYSINRHLGSIIRFFLKQKDPLMIEEYSKEINQVPNYNYEFTKSIILGKYTFISLLKDIIKSIYLRIRYRF